MYKDLDPILHSQLRLAIVSILVSVEKADFAYLKKETGATSGNLSVQITRLKEAGYIHVKKKFKGNFPQTTCTITTLGEEKFAAYVEAISGYLKPR
ncbi:MAG: transcriptional regulator [Bacteroides sp. SM1_62]|nr:MAG: transcriptional regulator [Bacteroides sp. SM23_62]KPL22914.1 MAG: transcriptional regulator [Bacteroides sp. SM1_62]